jgi:hypothetical protein
MTSAVMLALAVVTMQRPALEVVKRGEAERYGPGITHASHRVVKYELSRPAHVIVLLVSDHGEVRAVFPERQGDKTEKKKGRHGLSVGDVASTLPAYRVEGAPAEAKPGRFTPQTGSRVAGAGAAPEMEGTYWLVIAADVPTTALQVQAAIEARDREAGVATLIELLPQVLVGLRTTSWATYVTQAVER